MRGATKGSIISTRTFAFLLTGIGTISKNFYSHAPCGARRSYSPASSAPLPISTHTPHAGRDAAKVPAVLVASNFYSHAPCGARPGRSSRKSDRSQFLLTRPMRGATLKIEGLADGLQISTHTPHAGRDPEDFKMIDTIIISTHTPHAGRDGRPSGRK